MLKKSKKFEGTGFYKKLYFNKFFFKGVTQWEEEGEKESMGHKI